LGLFVGCRVHIRDIITYLIDFTLKLVQRIRRRHHRPVHGFSPSYSSNFRISPTAQLKPANFIDRFIQTFIIGLKHLLTRFKRAVCRHHFCHRSRLVNIGARKKEG
jgi:hypothetical protein